MDESAPPKPVFDPLSQRWRLRAIALVLLLGFLAVLVKLFIVQIVHGSDYRLKAKKQYEARVELRAHRGSITDRTGRVIATTVQSASFAADPKMIENPERISSLLQIVTGTDHTFFERKISQNANRNFVWLARGLSAHGVSALDSVRDLGFIRLAEPRRNYVFGSMASQLIGCTDVDNKGLAGIELAYDSLLRGEGGFHIMQRDGRGKIRPSVEGATKPARNGSGIQLTIDAEIQQIVENELQKGITDAQAQSGTVIAMNPRTGEILALATRPGYNPNMLSSASPELIRMRAISDMYEPGSTFKLVTAAAALEAKLVTPFSTVSGNNGELRWPDGTMIRDHEPLGECTLTHALENSSNIVFALLAQQMKSDHFYKLARDFGFGIPTGIDINGESRGLLKKPSEFDATSKLFMGFGYELAATALQVVNAYATIANGGVMMRPYVLKSVTSEDGARVRESEPQVIRRVVSAETAQTLAQMFAAVVENGTGKEANIQGLHISGKTGTAQQLVDGKYSKQSYTASFVGFFPTENPIFVMLVMLDRPQTDIYGGRTAAPIFRRIVQRIITSTELAGSMPELGSSALPGVQTDSVTVSDLRGLTTDEARKILHGVGLRFAPTGNGVIVAQQPQYGTRLIRGSEVKGTSLSVHSDSLMSVPDVRGLSQKRALSIMHSAGYSVRIHGTGKVVRQRVEAVGKNRVYHLDCSDK